MDIGRRDFLRLAMSGLAHGSVFYAVLGCSTPVLSAEDLAEEKKIRRLMTRMDRLMHQEEYLPQRREYEKRIRKSLGHLRARRYSAARHVLALCSGY